MLKDYEKQIIESLIIVYLTYGLKSGLTLGELMNNLTDRSFAEKFFNDINKFISEGYPLNRAIIASAREEGMDELATFLEDIIFSTNYQNYDIESITLNKASAKFNKFIEKYKTWNLAFISLSFLMPIIPGLVTLFKGIGYGIILMSLLLFVMIFLRLILRRIR